ncbi:MAG TPA: DEAD/DEAH box helicase [Desulfosporosinus sp.]|nr:DEAD/DEAH box helicase [Desulfosporosinus sp.]
MTKLRNYQEKAIEEIRAHFREVGEETLFLTSEKEPFRYESRRRVILQMATGAGKTATFAEMLKKCHQKGTPAMMAVKGAKLVHQASDRLTREGVPHGIFQAGNTRDTAEGIQVCSIDTLYARKIAPAAEFIVIDECHLTNGAAYQWLTTHENYRQSFFLGVSATPYSPTGLRHIGSKVIYPVTIGELISQGYLVDAKYKVPHKPNLQGVKKSGGDYNVKDLQRRMNEDGEKRALYGSLVDNWKKYASDKISILFGVTVEHAKDMGKELQKAGARTEHIDGKTPHDIRDAIISRLENRDIDVITSVGVLTTGVDIPSLECLIVCRPTASYNLWIQMLGRGTRPYKDKNDFLVLDLAGNTLKFGGIRSEMIGQVEPTRHKGDPSTLTSCPVCYAAFPRSERKQGDTHWICPACGSDMDPIKRDGDGKPIEHEEHVEIIDHDLEPWEIDLPLLLHRAKERGYKKGYIYHTLKVRYGVEIADKAWKRVQRLRRWPIKDPARNTQP